MHFYWVTVYVAKLWLIDVNSVLIFFFAQSDFVLICVAFLFMEIKNDNNYR